MNKKQYQLYLKSQRWKVIADECKKRASWRCQVCNSSLDLNAHHRTYDHLGDELAHMEDLICLCHRCHSIFHGKGTEKAPRMAQKTRKKEKRVKAPKTPPQKKPSFQERLKLMRQAIEHPFDHEADCPPDANITITKELWNKMYTVHGGHTDATINAFGVKRPLLSGWAGREIIGKTFPRDVVLEALRGRQKHRIGQLMRGELEKLGVKIP